MAGNALGLLLPFRPKLSSGECLTSWLWRICESMSCSNKQILKYLGYETYSSAVRLADLELGASDDFLARLAVATGSEINTVHQSTCKAFHAFTCTSSLTEYANAASSWILLPARRMSVAALPLYLSEQRILGGLQYCPICIGSPGFRLPLMWRLSFVTVCPAHNKLLRSSCPHCGKDVDFSITRGRRNSSAFPENRYLCRHCNGLLASSGAEEGEPLTGTQLSYLLSLQDLHLALLNQGIATDDHKIRDYFLLLEWLVNLNFPRRRKIPTDATSLGNFLAFVSKTKPFTPPRLIPQGKHTFRTYSPSERAKLLLMASVLLDPWPMHFRALSKISHFFSDSVSGATDWLPSYFVVPDSFRVRDYDPQQRGSSLAHYVLHASNKPQRVKLMKNWESLRWNRRPANLEIRASEYEKSGSNISLGSWRLFNLRRLR